MKLLVTLLLSSILLSCSKPNTAPTHTLMVALTSPANNGTLKAGETAQFTWTSSATDASAPVYHSVKITEILLDQSPEGALRTNKPFFERDSIERRLISITPSAGTPGFRVDKKYAWQITGKQKNLSINSSIFTVTIVR